jgi:uracil-DNA glycosylase family 4
MESMTVDDVPGASMRQPRPGKSTSPKRAQPDASVRSPEENTADWRAALKESGAQPAAKPGRHLGPVGPIARGAAPAMELVSGRSEGAMQTLDSLDAIAASVRGCTKCPLYSTATNPVPGEGNPDANFMVVGEAPGATEDETGRPFVGRAGQLLTQILAAIKLSREDVFICNVLKHRPPGNRNPEPAEVIACSPYLIRQIELIKPKVILALGTFSAQTLLDTKISIGKLRGQIHQYHGVPVVVTYHPAALLRNPAWKRPTWEDVQLARRILDSAVSGA